MAIELINFLIIRKGSFNLNERVMMPKVNVVIEELDVVVGAT